jgi:hypothetical protein
MSSLGSSVDASPCDELCDSFGGRIFGVSMDRHSVFSADSAFKAAGLCPEGNIAFRGPALAPSVLIFFDLVVEACFRDSKLKSRFNNFLGSSGRSGKTFFSTDDGVVLVEPPENVICNRSTIVS